jgi:hypothetical protein
MANFRVHKVTALPGTLQANSIYYVAPAARPDYVEVYMTGTSAATVKRIANTVDVQAMIDAAVSGLGGLAIVADIAARDALNPTANAMAVVLDASADPTVNSGSALYAYQFSTTSWLKLSEYESLDFTLTWESISVRPSSTPAQIDSAVSNSDTHANLSQLNQIGQDGDGDLTYSGNPVRTSWDTTGW